MKVLALPLTQTRLGEVTAMTSVHVNRTLQEPRAQKLILMASRVVTILDWERLQAEAGFDAAYLGLED